MRIGLLVLLALLGACGAAQSADIYHNIGYATGDVTNSIAGPSGVAGGIQGGY